MTRKSILFSLAACLVAASCDSETREGSLVLTGSAPVRIVDEGGKPVEFVSGQLKIEFDAHSNNKFSITIEQAGRKAKLSGRVPDGDSWNFTLRGREIGQTLDIASRRDIELYGERRTSIGRGGPCGRGTWVTEEQWQRCNEDWKVAFTDSGDSRSIGTFASRREAQSCLVASRNLYCEREFPDRDRPGPMVKTPAAIEKLAAQVEAGVKFD